MIWNYKGRSIILRRSPDIRITYPKSMKPSTPSLFTRITRGHVKLSSMFCLGYLLPFILGSATVYTFPPTQWGSKYAPLVAIGLLCLHQLLMLVLIWKSARNTTNKKAKTLGYISLIPPFAGSCALGFLLAPAYALNVGDGGVALSASGGQAFDESKLHATTIDGIEFGTHVSGPVLKHSDLKGKVVVMEYWGTYCVPCLQVLPHLSDVRNKHSQSDLAIIANQTMDASDEKAGKVFRKRVPNGENITVVNGASIKDIPVTAIPVAFIFARDGSLLWHGRPSGNEFDQIIEEACKSL